LTEIYYPDGIASLLYCQIKKIIFVVDSCRESNPVDYGKIQIFNRVAVAYFRFASPTGMYDWVFRSGYSIVSPTGIWIIQQSSVVIAKGCSLSVVKGQPEATPVSLNIIDNTM
jgi:hypothetical protein